MNDIDKQNRPHNAREILEEALDTIKATFWIAGNEFDFAIPAEMGWNTDAGRYDRDWDEWKKVNKYILAELSSDLDNSVLVNPEVNKAKVTGVCSIGALALANVTLYDEPLLGWDAISRRDIHTWKAGAALAMCIMESNTDYYTNSLIGSTIADWNDFHARTREEVIAMFTKALDHPLLTAETPYTLQYTFPGDGDKYNLNLWFPTEEAATEFVEGDSEFKNAVMRSYRTGIVLEAVPLEHEALTPA